jgi:hypothetical protein
MWTIHVVQGTHWAYGLHTAYHHTQNGWKPQHMRHTWDCKLRRCHHTCHAAFSTMPKLGLGGQLPVSHLKMLPPTMTGMPGVGFWRGGCPKSKPHMDQEKKGMWGFRPNRFKVSVTYIQCCKYFWQIATLQQRLRMQSVDVLQQNCVLLS